MNDVTNMSGDEENQGAASISASIGSITDPKQTAWDALVKQEVKPEDACVIAVDENSDSSIANKQVANACHLPNPEESNSSTEIR